MKKFFGRLLGKYLGSKLKLEDNMEDAKKWYRSKGVIGGLVTALIGVYAIVKAIVGPLFGFELPDLAEHKWLFGLLEGILGTGFGFLAFYGRIVADKKIG